MGLETIPTEKLIEGIKKAYTNAESFLNDVYVLNEYEKWPHAYTLCQFAIEELSKIQMLFHLWIDRINENEIDYKKLDVDFKDHIEKTRISIQSEMALFQSYKEQTGEKWVDNALKKGEEYIQSIKETNSMKNESLYVTVKNNDFQSLEDIITKEVFDDIYGTALMRKMIFENLMNGYEKHIYEIAKLVKGKINFEGNEVKSS